MVNYNQTYKNEVIVIIDENDGNFFDGSVSDNKVFSAVGQKTSNNLNNLSSVSKFSVWAVKADAILNLKDGSIKIYDDDGSLVTVNLNGYSNKQWNGLTYTRPTPLRFTNRDSNIRFDNFNRFNGMTQDIANLMDSENVLSFDLKTTTPNDIKCNYTTGIHSYVKGQGVNLTFDGNIKKGDKITIKRSGRSDLTSTIQFDTDLIFCNFNFDGVTNAEFIYSHGDTPQPPKPVEKTTVELQTTLQNAKIIEPQSIKDRYGKTRYYLDPKHTTIKLQANDGYTFESDGSLTYQRDLLDQATLTIKATHTNTVSITLPSDINWSIQQYFMLTMGAVKSEIVATTGGFTNIYKADYTNLLKFSNEVIVKITGSTGSSVQAYDVTPYINNLIMLPFNVPTGEKSTIVAGNETFTTQLPTIDNSYLTVDLGKIKVDEQYKNGFDYYQVKTRLMLPYTNMIELDPKHVINQTVSIKYIVNVVNGDTTINLSNNDDLFYSNQVNLASEIPFISSATKGSQYTVINQLKTVFRNSIKQAYIIIEQPTPVLNSDFYPTNEKGTLKGYTGNVKASLLNNMDINSNELNTLQNILETGVKIK